ncbi:MAG TPA: hypothetical protein VFH92_09215 [Phenylobacterium sp.]|nr:hypothetical protein [Phenylobacterium sp.]
MARPAEPRRRFPPPWIVTDDGHAFQISDANGFTITWIHYRQPDRFIGTDRAKRFERDEALKVARAIARLPEFLIAERVARAKVEPSQGR